MQSLMGISHGKLEVQYAQRNANGEDHVHDISRMIKMCQDNYVAFC